MNIDNIMTERLTIKDIIFTKALPNYNIPVSTDGYKIFPCTDCGDKFLFESSYEYHINRKSMKISYFCRHCMEVRIFYNRCKLLSHIRSHAFKSATITVSDLKIELLPLENVNLSLIPQNQATNHIIQHKTNVCHECNVIIDKNGVAFKERAAHYMQYTNKSYVCPICTFALPTICALEAHLRIHLNIPPFFCPECGMHLSNKVASYPFDHDCEGFKKMKSATRVECKFTGCSKIFHPDDCNDHFATHLRKVYRCSFCLEIWYGNKPLNKCLLCKNSNISSYIKCPLCPNKLIVESLIDKHLISHKASLPFHQNQCYPCTMCNMIYKKMYTLINHHVNTHSSVNLKKLLSKFTSDTKPPKGRKHVYHRVVKKCSKCLRSFTYRCLYENISKLPNDCPYKCISNTVGSEAQQADETNNDLRLICFLCNRKITQNWANIKAHYAEFHQNHQCLDIQILIKKLDKKMLPKKSKNRNTKFAAMKKKSIKQKIQANKSIINEEKAQSEQRPTDSNVCIICNHNCENSKHLETHMITHRDPSMAYQCLECGKCFVVKPSFSTHLLLEHSITDVEEYIDKKPCYNEAPLLKNENSSNPPIGEPVQENQWYNL